MPVSRPSIVRMPRKNDLSEAVRTGRIDEVLKNYESQHVDELLDHMVPDERRIIEAAQLRLRLCPLEKLSKQLTLDNVNSLDREHIVDLNALEVSKTHWAYRPGSEG